MKHSLTRRDFLLQAAATAGAWPALFGAAPIAASRVASKPEHNTLPAGVPNSCSPGADPAKKFAGVFAILATPFDHADQIDWEDLEHEVNFCARAGAQGLVWPQLFGEFYLLSEDERLHGAEVIVRAAGARLPVVIGVQAPASHLAVKFAQHAEKQGASAVISLPPYLGASDLQNAAGFFNALAQGTTVPIFIQNSGPPWGPALPTEFVLKMARQNSQFGYIKEEVAPVAHRIGEYAQSGVMHGIFSGNAGRNFLDEISHGADGTMPACEFIDVDAQIWALIREGNLPQARAVFEKLLPMINLEGIYGLQFSKEILVRRGVFKTAKLRGSAGGGLDQKDHHEIDAWWKGLAPYLRIQ
jgi:4-hydroxy-tetrahydrodipicolinate synthase